ncbi:hypothetical protein GCM10028807_19870 [Spirosoma daeguense]
MNEQASPTRTALKWGLILGIALIVYSAVTFLTNNTANTWAGLVSYGITIIGLTLAMRNFRSLNNGFITYGEGLTIGTLAAAISGFISSLFSVFYTTIIDTGFMERAAEKAREQMEDQGTMSDEQIDRTISMMEKFQSPGLLFVFGVFGSILIGLVFSLIIAAFIRRTKDNPFD